MLVYSRPCTFVVYYLTVFFKQTAQQKGRKNTRERNEGKCDETNVNHYLTLLLLSHSVNR